MVIENCWLSLFKYTIFSFSHWDPVKNNCSPCGPEGGGWIGVVGIKHRSISQRAPNEAERYYTTKYRILWCYLWYNLLYDSWTRSSFLDYSNWSISISTLFYTNILMSHDLPQQNMWLTFEKMSTFLLFCKHQSKCLVQMFD